MMFDLDAIVRDNIKNLKPYSSARHEFDGVADVNLDANENPFETGLNRYPDPFQRAIKEKLAVLRSVRSENIFLGNGSDEVIDLLLRAFCEPRRDNVLILPPTYGMYEVSANINDVEVRRANLTTDFQLDLKSIENQIDANTKLIFVCSPNNPTGNKVDSGTVEKLLAVFRGLVVVDEAYIDFASDSFVKKLSSYSNLFVMQTFSKAWGLAGVRMGTGFGSSDVINVLNKIKPPYNINVLTQETVLKSLLNPGSVKVRLSEILEERERMIAELENCAHVQKVHPSNSNFLLTRFSEPKKVYDYLREKGIVVRDRSSQPLCEGCLRITIGTKKENELLTKVLKEYRP